MNDLDLHANRVHKLLKHSGGRERRAKQTNKQVYLYSSEANVAIFVSSQRSLEKITESQVLCL